MKFAVQYGVAKWIEQKHWDFDYKVDSRLPKVFYLHNDFSYMQMVISNHWKLQLMKT